MEGASRAKRKEGQLPQSTYEEWLGRQRVNPTAVKPEVEMPTSSYEVWLNERVKKRVQTHDSGRRPAYLSGEASAVLITEAGQKQRTASRAAKSKAWDWVLGEV